jgi:hypothetical protein
MGGSGRGPCAYKEQYPGASQQNIANCFSHLWGKPILVVEKRNRRTKQVRVKLFKGCRM